MATQYYNIDRAALNVIIMDILEDILANVTEATYADGTDDHLVRLIAPLLSTIATVATSAMSDDVQTPESVGREPTLGGVVSGEPDEDHEVTASFDRGDGLLPSGDALSPATESSSELAPTPAVTAPLAVHDAAVKGLSEAEAEEQLRPEDDVSVEKTEPARGEAVFNNFGEIVGWLDPAAPAPAVPEPPRKSRWNSVKRFFRGLCCCCRRR